nr:hypothetical protein [Tanacetum cinerariifolium]
MREDLLCVELWVERDVPTSSCFPLHGPHVALDDNITIVESKRYPTDEYLHPYEPSQRYQVNNNAVSFIDLYERPKPVVIETNVSFDQHDQADQNDQNDHSAQNNEILNDDQFEHSNHNNDNHIIDNLPNTKDLLKTDVGMLTKAIAKELSAALAHECLFVDFLFEEEPKKVSEALKHLGWVDATQEELNYFARIKEYGNDNVTLNPTHVFSVHNWTLKKNKPEGPPFTDHILAIHKVDVPVEHKVLDTSSYTRKKDSKSKNPRAKSEQRKQPTSSKHHPLSKIKATKGGSCKAPTDFKTSYLVRETQDGKAVVSYNKEYGNDNVTLNPTHVFSVHNWTLKKNKPEGPPFTDHILAIHKVDVPVEHKVLDTSSYTRKKDSKSKNPRAKSEQRKQPTSSKHHPLSKIKATKAKSKAEADSSLSAPKDSISQPTETILTQPATRKGASDITTKIEEEFNTSPDLSSSEDTQKEIKLEDLSRLVHNVRVDFMDLNSQEDDPIIVVDESKVEEEDKEIHDAKHTDTKDTLAF